MNQDFEVVTVNSLDDVRCPICEGVINRKWFSHLFGNYAIFIAECWSGSLQKDQPRHLFWLQIELPKKGVQVHQGKEILGE